MKFTPTRDTDQFQNWVVGLSTDRLVGLAAQAGIAGWMTYPSDKLRELVGQSEEAYAVYRRTVASAA